MAKTLKIWNGRGMVCHKYEDKRWTSVNSSHAYICAYSRADARRVVEEYCGQLPPDSEIRDYFCEGAWGNSMEGVEHERGLWISFGNQYKAGNKPVRVV